MRAGRSFRARRAEDEMLRSARDIFGYRLQASDGEIGKVEDFFFDDQSWVVRYLVVRTGFFPENRRVLISPRALGRPDWNTRLLPVLLTKKQVSSSPDIDVDRPVSRQHELSLHNHYNWIPYWDAYAGPGSLGPMPAFPAEEKREDTPVKGDTHLQSMRDVAGYLVMVTEGEIGKTEDFIIDDEDMKVRYIVVAIEHNRAIKKVLVSPEWIKSIEWPQNSINLDTNRKTVLESPVYDPSSPVNRECEEVLYDYYGRPKYWHKPRGSDCDPIDTL
jgi:hypothetical protein